MASSDGDTDPGFAGGVVGDVDLPVDPALAHHGGEGHILEFSFLLEVSGYGFAQVDVGDGVGVHDQEVLRNYVPELHLSHYISEAKSSQTILFQ